MCDLNHIHTIGRNEDDYEDLEMYQLPLITLHNFYPVGNLRISGWKKDGIDRDFELFSL